MTDSNYNGMFKVSPAKRKFYNAKNKELTEHGFHEKCKYDMHNSAIYDMDGNFIEEGKQIDYNSCFLAILGNLNINEVKDFFNYHYDYTPNKETYLDYLEFGIINHKWFNEGGIREFVKRLIDEKRKELSEHSIKLKDTITQFLKDDLINNYKEWKQKLNNPLATELQFLEIEKTKCENAISKSKVMNNKLFHGEPSILLYKETNELTKLKIISERIIELSEPQQSNILPLKTVKVKDKKDEKNYSQKQIAIAYYILGITLNEKNYLGILKKHSKTTSPKILQKLITKNNQLTTLINNKTTDTKHLRDLNEAKRLLSGIKKTKEVTLINGYISTFESNYKNKY